MKLFTLLKELKIDKTSYTNHVIDDVVKNYSDVFENYIFVAIKHNNYDGHDYIMNAIEKKVSTIFIQDDIDDSFYSYPVNIIKVSDTREIYARLLKSVYNDISKKIKIIGITGTNGKSSTSYMLHRFFRSKKIDSILIGTNHIYYNEKKVEHPNTTPDIDYLYRIISFAVQAKYKYIIMEVSSIAIKEHRVSYIHFNTKILTNITEDHLDYHKTKEEYKRTKIDFINDDVKSTKIINTDDYSFFSIKQTKRTYQYGKNSYMVRLNFVNDNLQLSFQYKYNSVNYYVNTNLFGDFYVYNCLAVITTLISLDYKIEDIHYFLEKYEGINGRMNLIVKNNQRVLIDYAHTSIAVENVLKYINKRFNGPITTVVGCGGERDKTKRAKIGRLCEQYSTRVIVTNDNPRSENEDEIIQDILSKTRKKHIIIKDREKAINYALETSTTHSIVIILGRGDENKQYISDKVININDISIVEEYFKQCI